MSRTIEPVDGRYEVADGVALRVLRWLPADAPGSRSAPIPFLLVHGLASNARLWDGVAPRFAAAGNPVATVDLRGHGHSDKPDGGYDFATIAEDLRVLIAALGPEFDRPVLVGQSWGASVVLDFGVRHPDLTRGVVLVDGGLTDLREAFPTWEVCWDRLAPPPLVGMPLASVEGYFRSAHADWPEEGFEGSLGNFEIRADRTIAPWLSRDHHQAILRAMWDQRTADLWRSLRVPAMIVPVDGGESDWTLAKRAGAEAALASAAETGLPVRVEWFKGDHDIHAQHPAELTQAILAAEAAGLFSGALVP
ncbi:MAG: alpha/beta fold hydrolase [Candidatus Limnocylindrales bacterium]